MEEGGEKKLPWKNLQEGEEELLLAKGQENVAQRDAQLGKGQPRWSIERNNLGLLIGNKILMATTQLLC